MEREGKKRRWRVSHDDRYVLLMECKLGDPISSQQLEIV